MMKSVEKESAAPEWLMRKNPCKDIFERRKERVRIHITVREVLKLPALNTGVLVAGEQGMDNKIMSVNVMEVPDVSYFVKPFDMLITTTYPIKNDSHSLATLIPKLVENNVSALFIVPEYYNDVIPEWMVEQAEQLNFPLVKMPKGTSFNEVINPVLEEILNRRAVKLQKNIELQNKFINIVLKGESLNEVLNVITSVQKIHSSVYSANLHLLAQSDSTSYQDEERIINSIEEIYSLRKDMRFPDIRLSNQESINLYVKPIILGEEKYGYVVLWHQDAEQSLKVEIDMIEQASNAIALEINKYREKFETTQKLRSTIVEDLFNKKIKSESELLSLGQLYDLDFSFSFLPICIGFDILNRSNISQHSNKEYISVVKKVRDIIHTFFYQYDRKSIVIDIELNSLILLPIRKGMTNSGLTIDAMKTIESIQKEVARISSLTISAGIGNRNEAIMDLKTNYLQALSALQSSEDLNGKGSITLFENMGVYRILLTHGDEKLLHDFSRDFLSRLIRSDKEENTEYIRTLEIILQYYDNLRDVSRRLHVHYNTLHYRMNKIEEMLSINLKEPEVRINLQIALKIHKIMGK